VKYDVFSASTKFQLFFHHTLHIQVEPAPNYVYMLDREKREMEAQREQSDREATKEERAQRAENREGLADKREVKPFLILSSVKVLLLQEKKLSFEKLLLKRTRPACISHQAF
jgi:hypothetical protein